MRILLCFSLLSFLTLSGCATQTFSLTDARTAVESEPTLEKAQAFFVSGVGQQQELNAANICGGPSNVVKVETEETFLNGLLRVLSWGIYTPRDARVYCKKTDD